jgi:outer membrane protein TolC
MRFGKAIVSVIIIGVSLVAAPGLSLGQPQPPRKPDPKTGPRGAAPPAPPVETPPPDKDIPAMVTTPGGLTAEQSATRAMTSSVIAKAAEGAVESASAKSSGVASAFVPTVVFSASYTRLSELTNTSAFGGAKLVATLQPEGTQNPTPTAAITPPAFPSLSDNIVTRATLLVPLSDYLLKTNKAYSAATRSEDAARWDVATARAGSYLNGKQAYYDWLRARGAVYVTRQTLAVAQAHLRDATVQFDAGNVSKADVLRADTAVAAAELDVERALGAETNLSWHIRVVMHAPDDEKIEPGESLDDALPPASDDVKALIAEAMQKRPELKSIALNAEAARKSASAARGARLPSLNGVGDFTFANPNPRRFPSVAEFTPTWSVGAVLSWSPNDVLVQGAAAGDADARAAALEAQKDVQRDQVIKELVEAFTALRAADAAVKTTTRQLDSATEAYRVAHQQFQNGRTTGTVLLDAEVALAAARLAHLNARADARVTRALLEHATGRDARPPAP